MNTAIMLNNNSISEDQFDDTRWLQFFDVKQALEGLHAHIGSLASDQTPEKYTRHAYTRGIMYYIDWAGGLSMPLPTPKIIKKYIAHLLHEKEWYRGKTRKNGVSAKTVANAYLSPLRIFLRELKTQHIDVHGYERDYVIDCKQQIERALNIKNPPMSKKSNVAPLWRQEFVRLNPRQLNEVLTAIDTTTLSGARDYALLRLMFESALRVAEVRRVTLDNITPDDNHYLVTVRGKRGNHDPVAISSKAFEAIDRYITRYNAQLTQEDPRYIHPNMPIFQVIRKGDNHMSIEDVYNPQKHNTGKGKFHPDKGLYRKSIGDIVYRRTAEVLGKKYACKPHDCRRTFAYIAYTQGMPLPEISKALRHADTSITWQYIGTPPEYTNTLITNYIQIA